MKFEHYALNVPDSASMADWYAKNCRMKIVRAIDLEPHTRFLADETGRVVLEIYSNRAVEMPDFARMDSLEYHLAFAVDDPEAEKARLQEAGARFEDSVQPSEGTKLIMMRDPFGMALQICKRAEPL